MSKCSATSANFSRLHSWYKRGMPRVKSFWRCASRGSFSSSFFIRGISDAGIRYILPYFSPDMVPFLMYLIIVVLHIPSSRAASGTVTIRVIVDRRGEEVFRHQWQHQPLYTLKGKII